MALTPNTQAQIPEKSILDYFNRQVYLGNQFTIDTGLVSLSGTSEVPFLYIANPAASSFPNQQALFNTIQKLATDDVTGATGIVYRVYYNASSVSGGTTITPANCRIASATTSIATCLLSPTVGSKGTRVATYSTGWEQPNISNVCICIDPGNNVLITAQPTASTTGVGLVSFYQQ